MKRIISLLLVITLILPNLVVLVSAETKQADMLAETAEKTVPISQPSDGLLAGQDLSYLTISMKKYGDEITATETYDYITNVTVLEYTQWQLSAQYIRIVNGQIVEDKDVTNECEWTVTSNADSLSVTSYGLVSAQKASDVSHVVHVTYDSHNPGEGSDNLIDLNDASASIEFTVKKLAVAPEDEEALRCYAFTYLANYEWENMAAYEGKTVADWIADIQEDGYWTASSTTGEYLHAGEYEGSAKVFHFLSTAAGDCTILYTMEETEPTRLRTIVFRAGSQDYMAYAFSYPENDMLYADSFAVKENNGLRRYELLSKGSYDTDSANFQNGLELYNSVAAHGNSVKVTGQYFGGTIAKYISYVTGCQALTFDSPSPIQYVFANNFSELCQHYSGDQQLNYNSNDRYSRSTIYTMEPGYAVTRQWGCPLVYLIYSITDETISIPKNEGLKITQEQTLWNRRFYLGCAGFDAYDDTGATGLKINESVLFGGDDSDVLKVKLAQNSIIDPIKTSMGYFEMLQEDTSTISRTKRISKKIKFLKKLPDSWLDLIDIPNHSILDTNIICGGKGDDHLTGSCLNNAFCYSPGDGNDVYVLHGLLNKFYLVGYGDELIVRPEASEDGKLYYITINGTDRFTIDVSDCIFNGKLGSVAFYKGTPLDMVSVPVKVIEPGFANCIDSIDYWQFACPVEIQILDALGQVVQKLPDGKEYSAETEYGLFDVSFEDGEYVKTIILFDSNYRIQVCGTDNGEMKVKRIQWTPEEDDGQYCSIENIPVTKDAIYHASNDLEKYILAVDLDANGTIDDTITYDTTIAFAKEEIHVAYGTQSLLTPEIHSSSSDKECFWISADENVVTVNDEGLLTAVGFGETVIYVIVNDGSGAYAQCKVTVPEVTLSADDFTVTGMKQTYDYTGDVINVQLQVSYGELPLLQDVHYAASFSELIEPGKATLTITGINDYTGTLEISYEIIAPKEPETVEEKVDWIAAKCREEGITGEWGTALWLHDWLIYNANYDYTYTYYHPNGVLLEGRGVCQSYSEAYALLLDEFSIENIIIRAYEMDHAWNLVKIDGEWCHIDCTWNDPGIGGAERYDYFGMNDSMIAQDHRWPHDRYPASTSKINYYPVRTSKNMARSKEELEDIFVRLVEAKTSKFECSYVGEDEDINIVEEFANWWKENDWKYGLYSYQASTGCCPQHQFKWKMEVSITYTDPWEKPSEPTELLKCPDFTLRGPDGTYPFSNYNQNGMVLIIGTAVCYDIIPLLDEMRDNVAELSAKGVPVFVNETHTEEDLDYDKLVDLTTLKEEYPEFIFTYRDTNLEYQLIQIIGEYVYSPQGYQYVFVINKEGEIVYHAAGNAVNAHTVVAKANEVATGIPIPDPEPADERYFGCAFNYTGDKAELVEEIESQLAAKKTHITVRDGTWPGDIWDWENENLIEMMISICQGYQRKTNTDLHVKEYDIAIKFIGSYRKNASIEVNYTEEGFPFLEKPLAEVNLIDGKPMIEWWHSQAADTMEYRIYRSTDGINYEYIGRSDRYEGVGTFTSFPDEHAVSGEKYYYRVVAIDNDRNRSDYSNVVSLNDLLFKAIGDADGDTFVTPIDAMLVLQFYVGDIPEAVLNTAAADVDGDGFTTPIDAMLILQYYVGDIAKFPVQS